MRSLERSFFFIDSIFNDVCVKGSNWHVTLTKYLLIVPRTDIEPLTAITTQPEESKQTQLDKIFWECVTLFVISNTASWPPIKIAATTLPFLCFCLLLLRINGFSWWHQVQWNLSVTTTSLMKFITCDSFSNVFYWRLKVPIYSFLQFLPFGAHLGGPWPPRWAPEGREVSN